MELKTKTFFRSSLWKFILRCKMRPAVSDHLKKEYFTWLQNNSQERFNSEIQNKLFTLPEKATEHFRQLGLSKNFLPRKLSSTQTFLLNYLYSIDAFFTLKLKSNQRIFITISNPQLFFRHCEIFFEKKFHRRVPP